MSIESYRHRFGGELELPDFWYLDEHEVDNLCEMLNRGEVSYDQIEKLCEGLDNTLNLLNIKSKTQRSGQEENVIRSMTETIARLKPYRKKFKEQRDSGEIDLNHTIH